MAIDLTNLFAGYRKSSTYNPVDKKLLERALKPYKLTFGAAKNMTDSQIRRLAAQTVLKRYKEAQKPK